MSLATRADIGRGVARSMWRTARTSGCCDTASEYKSAVRHVLHSDRTMTTDVWVLRHGQRVQVSSETCAAQ